MNIALIGYGKMGRMIEEIALSRGHKIVCKIDVDNQADYPTDFGKDQTDFAHEAFVCAFAEVRMERLANFPFVFLYASAELFQRRETIGQRKRASCAEKPLLRFDQNGNFVVVHGMQDSLPTRR